MSSVGVIQIDPTTLGEVVRILKLYLEHSVCTVVSHTETFEDFDHMEVVFVTEVCVKYNLDQTTIVIKREGKGSEEISVVPDGLAPFSKLSIKDHVVQIHHTNELNQPFISNYVIMR